MRHLAVVVAAALVLAMIAPAAAQPFSDVPTNHWAYDAIAELAAKGLMEGYPDGTFKGDRAMTRYEMAMIVARLLARVESIQIPAPQAPQVTRTDVQSVQRLVNEFRAELAALGVRVTAIEEELNAIKAKMDNVRITGAWRLRYNVNRSGGAKSTSVNGNGQVASSDASNFPYLTQAIQEESVAFDGSVASNVHFVLKLVSTDAKGFTNFNSSTFGATSGQNLASIDSAYFDWKNAWGWPIEMKLGRQGCSASAIGRCDGVVFGPFGLVMDTTAYTWRDSTNDSGANAVDGFWVGGHHPAILDLQWQAAIIRVNGASNYASGEDAYGFDANIEIMPGLRVGGAYVANSIYSGANFQPTALAGVVGISDPNLWHLYGPSSQGVSAPGSRCIPVGPGPTTTGGFACPAQGYGYAGYIQWDILSGIHLDGEYAGWTDSVLGGTDTGYQVNAHLDLGTLTGIGHNVGLDVGYLNFGQNFYPPYGGTMADRGMLGNLYPSNEQGFKGGISYDITSDWNLYAIYFGGNTVSNGQPLSEYEAGVVYKFAPSAKIVFKIREERVNNIEQFQLYRAQIDYKF